MRWQDHSLLDGAVQRAVFAEDYLEFGPARFRVTSEAPADVRAVAEGGAAFRLRKKGLTVSRYSAKCEGRTYLAARTRGTHREITDERGNVVARTRGRIDGSLSVDADELTVDLVFITWALSLIDAPSRAVRRM